MKRNRLLSLGIMVTLLCASLSASAYDFEVDGIYYSYNYNNCHWDSQTQSYKYSDVSVAPQYLYNSNNASTYSGELSIPSTVEYEGENYSVTEIADYAFCYCDRLTKLTIPASIKKIRNRVFSFCSSLSTLIVEDGESEIEWGYGTVLDGSGSWYKDPMYHCPLSNVYIGRNITTSDPAEDYQPFRNKSIQILTIGEKVTSFNAYAFQYSSIKDVNYIGSLAQWCSIKFGNVSASPLSNGTAILRINGKTLDSDLVIPDGITEIGAYAFLNNKEILSLTLPNSVEKINTNAFNAPNLCKTVISSNVPASVEEDAFGKNSFLYVNNSAVEEYKTKWNKLSNRIFPISSLSPIVANTTAIPSGSGLVSAIGGVDKVSDVVTLKVNGTINSYDFIEMRYKMKNLRYLDLSDATIVQCDYPYYQSYSTQDNVLGAYCFNGVEQLNTVVLPKTITRIDDSAFSGLRYLFEVTGMPDCCTKVGSYAFSGCSNLRDVELSVGLEEIGQWAFSSCSMLSSVSFPNSVKTIGDGAFSGCSNLQRVDLHEGIETIASSAFSSTGITEVHIPSSVSIIGSNAFSGCSSLTNLKFENGLKVIESSAFNGCSSLEELKLPSSLESIGGSAFAGCTNLTEIHVPSMLSTIGYYAFGGCTAAKDVYAYTLSPLKIQDDTFYFDDVTLHAPSEPESVFWDYRYSQGWNRFTKFMPFDAKYSAWYMGENQDLTIEEDETIPNEDDDNLAEGEMLPGSGLIYKPGSWQWLDKLKLKWKGGKFPSLIENSGVQIDELVFNMEIEGKRWYFFCFPFNIKLDKCKFNGRYRWMYYDGDLRAKNGNGGWQVVEDNVLKAGEGYIFNAEKAGEIELCISFPTFTDADKKTTLADHESEDKPQDAGWNFIGNRNLSYFSLDNFFEHYNYPITVWDPVNNTYDAVMPGDDDYEFHPFEAFFVQKPADKSVVLFKKEGRETANQADQTMQVARRARAQKAIDPDRLIVNVMVSNDEMSDRTRVVFNDNRQIGYEQDCDASKFESADAAVELYTIDNKEVRYAINERPNDDRTVRLGFRAASEGVYYFSAQRMDCAMMLKDQQTGRVFDLSEGEYEFRSDAGTFDDRFLLIANPDVNGLQGVSQTGFAIESLKDGIALSGLNGETAFIYGVNGTLISATSENGVVDVPAGNYVVKLGEKSRKVSVK